MLPETPNLYLETPVPRPALRGKAPELSSLPRRFNAELLNLLELPFLPNLLKCSLLCEALRPLLLPRPYNKLSLLKDVLEPARYMPVVRGGFEPRFVLRNK